VAIKREVLSEETKILSITAWIAKPATLYAIEFEQGTGILSCFSLSLLGCLEKYTCEIVFEYRYPCPQQEFNGGQLLSLGGGLANLILIVLRKA
jgi:hypothetical protein